MANEFITAGETLFRNAARSTGAKGRGARAIIAGLILPCAGRGMVMRPGREMVFDFTTEMVETRARVLRLVLKGGGLQ